ncbi:MAG: tetratricopeptide repeat protein [Alphaproteobacteria bacterium]|nr:tetratricopeptide repeat protein [Alphaproteobacteria bacterium]
MTDTNEPEDQASSIDRAYRPHMSGWNDPYEVLSKCQEELKTQKRLKAPLEWASIQRRRATALLWIGKDGDKPDYLEEAIAVFRQSLEVWQFDQHPHEWARVQNQIGMAHNRLGESQNGDRHLEEAIAAHRAALTVWTRERFPQCWSDTHAWIGNALHKLGTRQANTALLEEAIRSVRAALDLYTHRGPANVIEHWDLVGNLTTLGETYRELGCIKGHIPHLRQAAKAFLDALPRLRADPVDYCRTMNELGETYLLIGAREAGTHHLKRARLAQTVAVSRLDWAKGDMPYLWARIHLRFGKVCMALGAREENTARYREAIEHFEEARDVLDYAASQGPGLFGSDEQNALRFQIDAVCHLSKAQLTLGVGQKDITVAKAAAQTLHAALTDDLRKALPEGWAEIQEALGDTLLTIGAIMEGAEGVACVRRGLVAFKEGLQALAGRRGEAASQTLIGSLKAKSEKGVALLETLRHTA